MTGFSKSKPLTAEIRKINAEIKALEPILAPSLPLSEETIGTALEGIRVYTLWGPDSDCVVIVRNLHTTDTKRDANQLAEKPDFRVFPKDNIRIHLPPLPWLKVDQVVDALTGQPIKWTSDVKGLDIELGRLDIGRIIWLKSKTGDQR